MSHKTACVTRTWTKKYAMFIKEIFLYAKTRWRWGEMNIHIPDCSWLTIRLSRACTTLITDNKKCAYFLSRKVLLFTVDIMRTWNFRSSLWQISPLVGLYEGADKYLDLLTKQQATGLKKKCIYSTYPPGAPHNLCFRCSNFFHPSEKILLVVL
jgi:hypothetical protein